VRFQKLMWRNMMRSTKSQKASVLHYSIDIYIYIYIYAKNIFFFFSSYRLIKFISIVQVKVTIKSSHH
jgi:hypothetical protein